MHGGRLARAADDQRAAVLRLEVLGDDRQPLLAVLLERAGVGAGDRGGVLAADAVLLRQGRCDRGVVAGLVA
ncbi:MAG: hypothetical protein ACK58X_07190, partial [Planctomycetota bacterium]